jgi:RND family efflux transporter MFP subunit
VAIGWWARDKAKVAALSGQARFEKRGDTARAIRDAMAEALRQERSVAVGKAPDASSEPAEPLESEESAVRPIDLAHQHLMEVCQTDRVVTHPLRSGDAMLGAWTFQWRRDRPATAADERLVAVATGQIGPVLDWARRADQGVVKRAGRTMAQAVSAVTGPGHLAAKLSGLAAVAFLAIMVFLKVPFRVGGECVLQPTPRRYITARFDGVLKQAYVKPGEVVPEGKLLAELEDYQLRNELGKAKAEWHKASKEADTYWSKGKIAEAQISRLEADKAQAQIDLLEFNLKHVKITAPIDGVVLSGDLERARGVPVQRGQVLFELAPLAEMTLEVAVPDADVARVQSGQKGEFALQARPERTLEFAVERVRPQAEIREEKNSFVVEATIKNVDGWLRPGMQGTAKISISNKPLGWVLTHRIVDWLRMKLWW